jgi:hypothetical protein
VKAPEIARPHDGGTNLLGHCPYRLSVLAGFCLIFERSASANP